MQSLEKIVAQWVMRSWFVIILVGLVGCQPHNVQSVIIPDTRDLRPAIVCNEKGECVKDEGRVTIDLGYLRELIDLLDVCRKQRI